MSDGHGGILIHDPPADDGVATTSGPGNGMATRPFHDLVAGKLNPIANGIVRGADDSFVFKFTLGNQTAPDCDHGPHLPELNKPGAAGVTDLLAIIAHDGHGEPSIPPGSLDAIQDSLKAHLLVSHANFNFL